MADLAALLAETEKLKFLVAFRPGLVPPTLAAQQTATLQRFSEGRVLLNVVSGGDDAEQRRFGDWLSHDERYARTAEFLQIVTSVWTQDSVDFTGSTTPSRTPGVSAAESVAPDLFRRFIGGCAADRGRIRGRLPDLGRAAGAAAAKIDKVRARAAALGRRVRFGIRYTPSAATLRLRLGPWPTSWLPISPTNRLPKPLLCIPSSESEGQRRMTALHGGRLDRLEIYPNLWPEWAWSAAVPAPPWWAATRKSRT